MYQRAAAVLLLLPVLPAAGGDDKPKQTPESQYQALVGEYQEKLRAFEKALQEAKTLPERQKAFRLHNPQPNAYAARFLDLAEKNPKDPVAPAALAWVVANTESQGRAGPGARALALLARDYVSSPHVGPACLAVTGAIGKQTEAFLRGVLDRNPSRDAQGAACLALGEYLTNRTSAAQLLKGQPQLAGKYAAMLGRDYYLELVRLDPAAADKEAAELFQRAADTFGDVKVADVTVAGKAKMHLARGKAPEVGKEAPDIAAEDLDGKPFKLSDYCGKVVLLDFWGNW
jgi:hypothetical protein